MAKVSVLDRVATVAVIVSAAAILWTVGDRYLGRMWRKSPTRGTPIPVPAEPLSLAGAWIEGSGTASAAMIVFSDFQCPYCAKFAMDTLPTLQKEFVAPGKLRIAFRHLPLELIHPYALQAAVAANCAGDQGRFWDFHTSLFKSYRTLAILDYGQVAKDLKIPLKGFQECVTAGRVDRVRADQALAETLSVKGTPAFFLGTAGDGDSVRIQKVLNGARSLDEFRTAIGEVVKVQ